MGRNGMGKTTTIRSIFGLTPPSKGEIRVFGKVVTTSEPHVIARHGLGLVPEGRQIFADLSVEQGTGSNSNDTLVSITATGEYLAIVEGINATALTEADFTPVDIL
jgi:ABC-type lipopolysaccharide export system ATPase subunit